MRSMTGFGRGVSERGATRATIDVRSVNHRFLDLKLRGAPLAPALEDAIGTKVRGAVERGAVTVSVHLARRDAPAGTRIDRAAARAAHTALAELAAELEIAGPALELVLAQPGVVVSGDEPDDTVDATVLAASEAALVQLAQMRDTEGRALERELASRIDELAKLRARVAQLASTVPEQLQKRLHERLRRLLPADKTDETVDPQRLAQEIALLADRADVTEELVRLASHLHQARELIGTAGAVGRRLDFLVQEIGRELNTIGSKSAVAEISSAVVDAKAVLEKVREQVQNVE